MGLRESINNSPKIRYATIGIIAVLILGSFALQMKGTPERTKSFFTIDDGATYFVDDSSQIPPFTESGKPAVGCEVFTCDGGKTRFVGFLYRFKPAAQARFDSLKKSAATSGFEFDDYIARRDAIDSATREVKPPLSGPNGWVLARGNRRGETITHVVCPGTGKSQDIESVMP